MKSLTVVPGRDDAGRLALSNRFQTIRSQFDNCVPNIPFRLIFSTLTWNSQYQCFALDIPGEVHPYYAFTPQPCNTMRTSSVSVYYLAGARDMNDLSSSAYTTGLNQCLIPCEHSHCLHLQRLYNIFVLEQCVNIDPYKQRDFLQRNGADVLTCSNGFDIGIFGCEGMFNERARLVPVTYIYILLSHCIYLIL